MQLFVQAPETHWSNSLCWPAARLLPPPREMPAKFVSLCARRPTSAVGQNHLFVVAAAAAAEEEYNAWPCRAWF